MNNKKISRMFPQLDPWRPPKWKGMKESEIDRAIQKYVNENMVREQDQSDSKTPVGYSYLGQFINHDINFETLSSSESKNRSPLLNLDSVYSDNFTAQASSLSSDCETFIIGKGVEDQNGKRHEPDLPRRKYNENASAKIADRRNDENIIISNIHLAFLLMHNKVLQFFRNKNLPKSERFIKTKQIITWLYQYIVWHDFLPRIVNLEILKNVVADEQKRDRNLGRNKFSNPAEFYAAAFRFGHSMVLENYRVSQTLESEFGEAVPIFSRDLNERSLRGGRFLPRKFTLQWDWFLEFPTSSNGFPQMANSIQPFLAKPLFNVPDKARFLSLAFLDFKTVWQLGLPSGTDVAKALGVGPVDVSEMENNLWVYILKEAQVLGKGRLGPVGSTIVARVFSNLICGDSSSFLNQKEPWEPNMEEVFSSHNPVVAGGTWSFADLIKFAGMPITNQQTGQLVFTGRFQTS